MKKTLLIIFAICMLLSAASVTSMAVSRDYSNDWYDETEYNDSRSTADYIYNDYYVSGYVYGDDTDYFRFTLSSTYRISISCVSDYSYLIYGILDSYGDVVAVGSYSGYSSGSYTYTLNTTLYSGTYYIMIYNQGSQSVYNSYMFHYTRTSSSSSSTHYHSYSNSCDSTCNTCGYTRSASHSYSNSCDAYCDICGSSRYVSHSYSDSCDTICNNCGYTRYVSHSYDNSCDATCNNCGYKRTTSGHSTNGESPTCAKGVRCTICGKIAKQPLGHTYSGKCDGPCIRCGKVPSKPSHKYTNNCDTSCNVCGTKRTITHTYKNVVTKATLSKDGNIAKKCSVCGKVASKTTIKYAKTFTLSSTSYTYNGYEKKPAVTVKDSSGKTISSSNYTVSYSSGRKNAGEYKVTVKMKGNYSGTKTLTFKIKPIDISKCSVKLSATSFTYDGNAKKPNIVVKNANGTTLKNGTHYTVKYSSGCTAIGTYTATVTMKGNYSGTKKLTFKVVPIKVDTCKISLSAKSYTYDGKVKTPSVVVKNAKGTTLTKGTHYTVTYSGNRQSAGSYNVKVTMKGNYSGSKTLTFKINPIKIEKCKITLSAKTFAYNGKTQTPTVVVKNASGKTLTNGTHYSVAYSKGCKNVGTYTATVTMKGNYTGTKNFTFQILPTSITTVEIPLGETYKISAKSNRIISYSTSDKNIASVNYRGVITAKAVGTAIINVSSHKVSQDIKVTVFKPSIKISASDKSVQVGDKLTFTAKVKPSNAKVSWSVNNTKLATISASGVLTAKAVGTVTVTGSISYAGNTYKSTYKVTITADYPDISVFTSHSTKYSSSYAFNITNNGNATLKILARGYVYSQGDSANITSLFLENDGYCSAATLSAGGSGTLAATLDSELLFYEDQYAHLVFYVEYKGELFKIDCDNTLYGMNKCYEITWLYD